jgi:peptide chain release factor subunit 1
VIDAAGVTRLLGIRSPDHRIVSVYLTVPLDPAQRRGVPAHLDEVLAHGHEVCDDGAAWASVRRSELPVIRRVVSTHAHEWLGHSVAIFACAKLRLLETIPLRGQVRDLAVIGSRPYVRPLLAELQRCPCYAVAVVDRRHAWLFRVTGDSISPEDHVQSQTVGSKKFGGWHGFQSYRNDQRARKLARQHYAAAGAALASIVGEGGCGPIVVGGHEPETSDFAAGLPPGLRGRVAGTFVIDPHTMTPARVRQLADEVVAGWEDRREQGLAAELAAQPVGGRTVMGVDACLAAANQHAIQLLVVPDDEVRPGFSCENCGALAVAGGACGACGGPTRPVGDVIEELAVRVTQEGGSVHSVRGTEVLTDVAARRRFPAVA